MSEIERESESVRLSESESESERERSNNTSPQGSTAMQTGRRPQKSRMENFIFARGAGAHIAAMVFERPEWPTAIC